MENKSEFAIFEALLAVRVPILFFWVLMLLVSQVDTNISEDEVSRFLRNAGIYLLPKRRTHKVHLKQLTVSDTVFLLRINRCQEALENE
jgi:hypothetical protein